MGLRTEPPQLKKSAKKLECLFFFSPGKNIYASITRVDLYRKATSKSNLWYPVAAHHNAKLQGTQVTMGALIQKPIE